jgi:dinuclear metal center YbgI/SA1388 family protein
MSDLESIVSFCDNLLGTGDTPDYPGAGNGLQVAGPPDRPVHRIAAAVDASEAVIRDAVADGADLLMVHHGLFWGGLTPVTGPRYRKLRLLLEHGLALYSSHLPLDGHPELGNGALLADALGVRDRLPFGDFKGYSVGWRGTIGPLSPPELRERFARALDGADIRHIGGGPDTIHSVAVVTGGGGSFLPEAASVGVDALLTGEGAHHTFAQAHEHGLHLLYGGHYATETFGVRALAGRVAEEFGVEWRFLHHPSGL